jgi:hypothetical protein
MSARPDVVRVEGRRHALRKLARKDKCTVSVAASEIIVREKKNLVEAKWDKNKKAAKCKRGGNYREEQQAASYVFGELDRTFRNSFQSSSVSPVTKSGKPVALIIFEITS